MSNKNLKILHLVFDDKFIDRAYREFETVAPGSGDYVCIDAQRPLSHIVETPVQIMSYDEFSSTVDFERYAAVIFHSLRDHRLVESVPQGVKILWIGWGYDYYDLLLSRAYPQGMILPGTRELLKSGTGGGYERILDWARGLFPAYRRKKYLRRMRRVAEKIDYFSPVIRTEFDMAVSLNRGFSPEYVPWNYGTAEDDLAIEPHHETQPGPDLLVGNSAVPTNNHVEILDLLNRHVNVDGRRIIAPMSYGDPVYRDEVIKLGKRYFGDQFMPLTEFVPLDEYKKLISSCGFVFMNQLRQQGYANISGMMMKGARIYMNPTSPLFTWLRDAGAVVEPIEHASFAVDTEKSELVPLSNEERSRNYDFVLAERGRSAQREKTRKLVDKLLYGN